MKIQKAITLKFIGMDKYLTFLRKGTDLKDYAIKLQLDCDLSALLNPGC